MANKKCSKCKQELPATPGYFYRDKSRKDGLRPDCKKCVGKYHQKQREQYNEYQRKYYRTIKGYLATIYDSINQRCSSSKCKDYNRYGGRGIENRFKSIDDFRDYIINTLGYDTYEKIKGLQIDRIDNGGHYQKGNIRFVTPKQNSNNRRK